MRYRACPCCQEVLPQEEFFRATNPDPMHTPLCGYCLGVHPGGRKGPSAPDAFAAESLTSEQSRKPQPA
jgi:hypothetical protein